MIDLNNDILIQKTQTNKKYKVLGRSIYRENCSDNSEVVILEDIETGKLFVEDEVCINAFVGVVGQDSFVKEALYIYI